ncbi:hypothetical protein A9Q99_21270 [Gammaproteobacteria bacterium 45_16_T64]|nr:hypothetical protein A9Q99_21270 [Gammaproteobacteria bacterium 45_16_T64]
MTVYDIVSKLNDAGIKVWVDDGQLKVKAPKGALTKALKDEIVANKSELIQFLPSVQRSERKEDNIPVVSREGDLALSYAQQRMWFLAQLEPGNTAYHIRAALDITGDLDVDALQRAINHLIDRHESLRTTFSETDGVPSQRIHRNVEFSLSSYTLTTQTLHDVFSQFVDEPFDLSSDRLFRASLVYNADNKHVLMIVMHHIISDGWSAAVMVRELSALYASSASQVADTLPPVKIQYVDYAYWQKSWLSGEKERSQLAYWTKQLENVPILELPTDTARPPIKRPVGSVVSFEIKSPLVENAKRIAKQQNASLFMVLFSAFNAFLYRYTGQADFSVGTPIANRANAQLEATLGLFVNTLAIRAPFQRDVTFVDYVSLVRKVAMDAFEHQDIPFERIVDAMGVSRDMSHTPIFQVMFVLQNTPGGTKITLPGVTVEPINMARNTSPMDITMTLVEEVDGSISGELEFSTDLYTRNTAHQMCGHYVSYLDSILENPHQHITHVDYLSVEEKQHVLGNLGSVKQCYEANLTLDRWFEQTVERYPDQVAITDVGISLTYDALNKKANLLARDLQEEGVEQGAYVGISLERSSNVVIAILSVLKVGAIYVPVDPTNPKERIRFILDDAQVNTVIVDDHSRVKLPLEGRQCINVGEGNRSTIDDNVVRSHGATDTAYVIYTSGTTGKPKGVQIPHANVERLFHATDSDFGFSSSDVWTMFHSYAFDFSVWEMWGALLFGGRLVIVPKGVAQSPSEFYALLQKEKVTVLNQTPTAFTHLIKEDEIQCLDDSQSSTSPRLPRLPRLPLRYVIFGGEALDFTALERWVGRHGINAPSLINMYGITETTIHVTYHKISEVDLINKRSLIGRPIDDLSLVILDENLQLVPAGVAGEMYVGGAGLALGYLHRPELTRERFIAYPSTLNATGLLGNSKSHVNTGRLYKTGDVARYVRDDNNTGVIEYLGRADDQVKIRGYRIELGEIESTLSGYSDVSASVATIFADVNGQHHIVAYVTGNTRVSVDVGELKAYLVKHLPEYMIPTQIFTVDVFPLTSNGKVNKQELPTPDLCGAAADNFVAPSSDDEIQVHSIWKEVLGIDVISTHANFFEIGGHSLLATQVISRIRNILNLELSLKTLFEYPTIQLLSSQVKSARESQSGVNTPSVIVPQTIGEKKVLSFAQHRLWFVDQLDNDTTAYNLPVALLLRGKVSADALEQAFRVILSRHCVLCTQYVERDGEPATIYKDASLWCMERELITVEGNETAVFVSDDRIDNRIDKSIEAYADKHFNLANDWLFRSKLIDCGEDRHVLLLNMHHIVSDGWSMGVLVNELKTLLKTNNPELGLTPEHAIDNAKDLSALPIQYEDYAAWQREWLSGDNIEHLKRYWVDALEGAPAVLRLPTDFPRPEKPTFNGAHFDIDIGVESTQKLMDYCAENAVTPFMVLMSAYQILLGRYTHQEDICVGIPIANRNQYEIEGLIGFFVNGMIIRGRQHGNPTRRGFIESIKDAALGAFVHQDMPMDVLVDTLQMSGGGSYAPGAQVAFALQNMPNLASLSMPGLAVELLEREHKTAKYELTLLLEERGESIAGVLEFNTDLFSVDTIGLMAVHYKSVLEQLLAEPTQSISTITFASSSELERIFSCDDSIFPLSPMERDVYLDIISDPSSLRNSIGSSCVFNQEFDVTLFQKAFELLVSQNPLMKAQVVSNDIPYLDVAYFKIDESRTLTPKIYDYSDKEWSDAAITSLVERTVYRPYDLFNDDLYGVSFFTLDRSRTLLVVSVCHLVADGAALFTSFQDLFAAFGGPVEGGLVANFVDDRHDHVGRSRQLFDTEKTLSYWQKQCLDVEALQFSMPLEHADTDSSLNAALPSGRIEDFLVIDKAEFSDIKQYCSTLGVHTAVYFKALYLLLLHYYCRPQSDFYFGEIVAGRSKKFRHTFGCFFQTLPTIIPHDLLADGNDFEDVVAFLQSYKMSARRYDKISQLAQRNIFPKAEQNFLYNYYNFIAEVSWNDETETLLPHPQIQDEPVQFIAQEYADHFLLQFVSNTQTFESLGFMARLHELSKQVLSGVSSLTALDFLLPHEAQLLADHALDGDRYQTTADEQVDVSSTLVDRILDQCERSPNAIAIKHAESSLCYEELDQQSRQWAGYFAAKGVAPGQRVVVCLKPGLALFPVLLGVLRVGAVYVPVDAGYPVDRIHYIVEDSNSDIIVTEHCVHSRLVALFEDENNKMIVSVEEAAGELTQYASFDSSSYRPTPDSMMYVIYTSGSTGKPKGAGVYHRGVSNLLHWYIDSLSINSSDAFLLLSSVGFDLTQKNPWAAFCTGAKLVIPEMDQYDPDTIAKALVKESITWLNCAPSAFYPLVEEGDLQGYPFASLRHVVLGGESIRLPIVNQWLRKDHGHVALVNSYGPTECTDVVASYLYAPGGNNDADGFDLPIGQAIPNVQLHIVDERNQRVAPGLVGELCVSGAAVGAGYIGNSELTELSFIENPFGKGLLYKTGDLARLRPESGQISYIGRKDFQVKVRGLRIELGEIEYALRQQDAVLDALALVDSDSIVAYALLDKSNVGMDTRILIDGLHRLLPDYMVPNHLVVVDKWPLTANGKIDRKNLPKYIAQGIQDYVAPTTDTEIRLANIWRDVLNIEKVGVLDNFFDLGGHSLLAARVISKLRKEFSVEISLRVLFEMRTVSDISRYIDRLNWAVQSQTHGSSVRGMEGEDHDTGSFDDEGQLDETDLDSPTEEGFL